MARPKPSLRERDGYTAIIVAITGMGVIGGGEEGDRRRGDHLHAREGWEREGWEEGAGAAHPR